MKKITPACIWIIGMWLFTSSAIAQQQLNTPADLKNACQNNPGNIVTINQSTKISLPSAPFTPEQINCGCTVILNNEATFEFEKVNIQFAGAFAVQSSAKGEIKLSNALVAATSFAFNLAATGSSFATSESSVLASAGNIAVTLGQQAKM